VNLGLIDLQLLVEMVDRAIQENLAKPQDRETEDGRAIIRKTRELADLKQKLLGGSRFS
jgi:hypothetical protein